MIADKLIIVPSVDKFQDLEFFRVKFKLLEAEYRVGRNAVYCTEVAYDLPYGVPLTHSLNAVENETPRRKLNPDVLMGNVLFIKAVVTVSKAEKAVNYILKMVLHGFYQFFFGYCPHFQQGRAYTAVFLAGDAFFKLFDCYKGAFKAVDSDTVINIAGYRKNYLSVLE